MGEELLALPLEILNEKEVFDTGLTIGEILERAGIDRKKGVSKDRTELYKRIFGMHDDGLISLMNPWDKSNLDQYTRDEHLFTNVDSIRIRISATGFGLLNDIRMKKIMQETTTSINELNKGIKDFKESSNKASNWLILLTAVIIIATAIQIFIALKWFGL